MAGDFSAQSRQRRDSVSSHKPDFTVQAASGKRVETSTPLIFGWVLSGTLSATPKLGCSQDYASPLGPYRADISLGGSSGDPKFAEAAVAKMTFSDLISERITSIS